MSNGQYLGSAEWVDCPGCAKCDPNGGYVLRKGSWRCTKAHEYLFQLTKSDRYFCDMEAVKEPCETNPHESGYVNGSDYAQGPMDRGGHSQREDPKRIWGNSGRNLRDCWAINPQAYKGAHYATFPERLVEPCIKVSTSQKGVCPKCGSPWARVIESRQIKRERPADRTDRHNQGDGVNSCGNTVAGVDTNTIGWRPTCHCGIQETAPALCYDPFMGSGTVAAVAARLGRNYCGSELSAKYLSEQATIRVKAAEHGMDMEEIKAGQGALFP